MLGLWEATPSTPSITDTRSGVLRLLAADLQALLIAEESGVLIGSLIAAWMGGEVASTGSRCIPINDGKDSPVHYFGRARVAS